MDDGETTVSKNGLQYSKMAERTSMSKRALFCPGLQKQMWTQSEWRNRFWKTAILNSKFVHSHGDVYQKHRHLCPLRNGSHNSIFTLCIGLAPSQLNTKLFIENWVIIKVVYSWVPVECCRMDEDKIDVPKLLFYMYSCLKRKMWMI
jgi:hypothetical protein